MDENLVNAESIGLIIARGEEARLAYHRKLMELVRDENHWQDYFVWIPNHLAAEGRFVNPIQIESDDWREMDFVEDLDEVRSRISSWDE